MSAVVEFHERSGPAFWAESLLVFPAKSQQEFPGGRLVPNQVFVGFEIHDTILFWCQILTIT